MNHYEYKLVDQTLGTVDADYYLKDSVDYAFYKNGEVVWRIPVGWLVSLNQNGRRVI